MRARYLVCCWLVGGVLSSCATPSGASTPDSPRPKPESWQAWMAEVVGPGFEDVLAVEAAKSPAAMDLAAVARTAAAMAEGMALGYGPLERREVAEFGALARASQAWLDQIARAATAGRAIETAELVRRSEQHCDRCHDAASEPR